MLDKMNVPELRFSEFQGKWSRQTFKDLKINVIDGDRGTNYPNKGDLLPEGDCLFLTAKNVTKYGFKFSERQFITKQKDQLLRNGKLIRGDIILTTRGSIGHKALYSDHITFDSVRVNSGMVLLRNEWTVLSNDFVYKSMFANNFTKQIGVVAFGSAQPALTVKEIYKLKLSVPPTFPEQQKIASFLSTVDKKIELLTEKKAKLTEYKKGVMQQLFNGKFEQNIQDSLGGKTTFIPPTLRFKADDGSDFPDWEKKKFSDFVLNHKGGAPLKPSDFVKLPEYEVIPKKAIQSGGKLVLDKSNPTYCSKSFFTQYQKNIINDEYLVTTLRDLVPSGPTIGFIVRNDCKADLMLAQGVYGFRVNDLLDEDFLIHQSNTAHYRKLMQQLIVGSTQVHIRNDDFFGMSMVLPTLPEQVKIANFLSATNQKINLVNLELEKAKEWKKGLLQQMFV